MKTEIEVQQENINNLMKLAKENPNLRIMPMVDEDVVVGNEFNSCLGHWGKPEIDEIWCEDERMYIKSQDYDELLEKFTEGYNEGHPTNEEEIEKWSKEQVNNLPWEKVIIVNIESL